MQLVIHAPFGARINRAWGLALRKCFCRTFDFELQASADDNGIVLPIGPQQSFPLEQMFTLLDSAIAQDVLIQALLAVPMFRRPLAVERDAGAGRAAAARRQESAAAFAAVPRRRFADGRVSRCRRPASSIARATWSRPIIRSCSKRCTIACTRRWTCRAGWTFCATSRPAGSSSSARDTREPSPFSHQLAQRQSRTRFSTMRRWKSGGRGPSPCGERFAPDDVRDLGRLDPEAIAQVRAKPGRSCAMPRNCTTRCFRSVRCRKPKAAEWREFFERVGRAGQGGSAARSPVAPRLWIAVEQWPAVHAALSLTDPTPPASLARIAAREVVD